MFYEVVLDDFRGSANCKKLKSCGLTYAGENFHFESVENI